MSKCFITNFKFMKANSTSLLQLHYKHVNSHVNQTMLVEKLLKSEIISYDDISWFYNEAMDEYTEVYQWIVFNNFSEYDYEKLIANNIPVIQSEYGNWIGITSFWSHYDLYVYPEIINALFGTNITYKDIEDIY